MFEYPVVFVDIETTGGSYRNSRVLEVAAIRYENGKITKEFSTLINPETYVPAQITQITGIRQNDIVDAPTFGEIAEELEEVMEGAVFVAHNVRFDYSFLRNEFALVGIEWSPRLLCTVRLSRALYSQEKGHSLAKLIERHEIPVLDRHRALEDARAILYFSKLAFEQHGAELFNEAVSKQLKSQYLPPHLDEAEIKDIGNGPGVYIFKDEAHQPIYIGKSVTLKKRILSHFQDKSSKEIKISQHVYHIDTIPTSNELAALILESKLIKEKQPLYNRLLRRVSLYAMLYKDDSEEYAKLEVKSGSIESTTDLDKVYGVYTSRMKAKNKIVEVTQLFKLCPKLMGIEKGKGSCFSYELGKCNGACIGKEDPELYNRRFELALEHTRIATWPFESPVVIPVNSTGESVIINNWIIQGYIDESGEAVFEANEPMFSIDEYKITRRFIRENQAFIKPFQAF
jgi:DNA polymerase-3 subunit epsilon